MLQQVLYLNAVLQRKEVFFKERELQGTMTGIPNGQGEKYKPQQVQFILVELSYNLYDLNLFYFVFVVRFTIMQYLLYMRLLQENVRGLVLEQKLFFFFDYSIICSPFSYKQIFIQSVSLVDSFTVKFYLQRSQIQQTLAGTTAFPEWRTVQFADTVTMNAKSSNKNKLKFILQSDLNIINQQQQYLHKQEYQLYLFQNICHKKNIIGCRECNKTSGDRNNQKKIIQGIQIFLFYWQIQLKFLKIARAVLMTKQTNPDKNTISEGFSLFVILFATGNFIFLIILNGIIETPLYQMGMNYQYKYQQQFKSHAYKQFNNYITLLINLSNLDILTFVYVLLSKRKLVVLTHIMFFHVAKSIGFFLKQNFQNPRPFWSHDKIQNLEWKCKSDFGNPSDHLLFVIMFIEPILSDIIGYIGPKSCKILGWFLGFFVLVIMNSRLYLGVHGLNQVLFGLALGTTLIVSYKYGYQKALLELFFSLMTQKRNYIRIIKIALISLLLILSPIAFFHINKTIRPVNQALVNRVNKVCHGNTTSEQMQSLQFFVNSYIAIAVGIVFGFIFLKDTPSNRQYISGKWQYKNTHKLFLHFVLYLLLIGVPYKSIPHFTRLMNGGEIKYLISVVIGLSSGFCMSFAIPTLVQKLNIMKKSPENVIDIELI